MLSATTRIAIGVLGALMVVAGLAVTASGAAAATSGLWITIMGAAIIVALVFERHRYRSEAADGAWLAAAGSARLECPVEPRFRPTDERFVDPTTHHTMRVHVDPRTGERRYVAET
jgi:hypothetical protein